VVKHRAAKYAQVKKVCLEFDFECSCCSPSASYIASASRPCSTNITEVYPAIIAIVNAEFRNV
jgi:hypothetical protein